MHMNWYGTGKRLSTANFYRDRLAGLFITSVVTPCKQFGSAANYATCPRQGFCSAVQTSMALSCL